MIPVRTVHPLTTLHELLDIHEIAVDRNLVDFLNYYSSNEDDPDISIELNFDIDLSDIVNTFPC